MKFAEPGGDAADRQRRILKDIQYAKRHKNLQELHEYKQKMRRDVEAAGKINELRRIEGYLARIQPGMRLAYIQNRLDMLEKRKQLHASIGLSSTPL